jgi:hypothetical protein
MVFGPVTRVPSTSSENVSRSVAGVSNPVHAVVVDLAAYELIMGNPRFTRHNPVVDWRRNQLRLLIDGRTVVVDTLASPQRESSQDITRISAMQLKKVARRQEPVYLVHLSQTGVGPGPGKRQSFAQCMEMHSERIFGCISRRPTRPTPSTLSRYGD